MSHLIDSHSVMVLHGWAAEHHHSSLWSPFFRRKGGENAKGSRVEIGLGDSPSILPEGKRMW